MAVDVRISVEGLRDFQRDLRRVSPQLARTLQVAHKGIATRVAAEIRPAVQSLPTPGGTRGAPGVTPRASQREARIALSAAKSRKPLLANVLGANVHPVFGRRMPVSRMRRRVWQPHLGASWKPEQLYGVGPVVERSVKTFVKEDYEDAVMEAMRVAFPGAR